jgi:hypothetical protein
MALHTGTNPVFFRQDQCSDPFFSYPKAFGIYSKKDMPFPDLDGRVVEAWQVTRGFCSLLSLAAEAQGKIPWELFSRTMSSVMYRLLHMSFDSGSLDEAVRLALLILCSDIFVQWKYVTISYHHLAASYKDCLEHLESSGDVSINAYLWLLMIGGISVFKQADEHWLNPRLRAYIEYSGGNSWGEVRAVLCSFLWVGLVQDAPGATIFNSVLDLNRGHVDYLGYLK